MLIQQSIKMKKEFSYKQHKKHSEMYCAKVGKYVERMFVQLH